MHTSFNISTRNKGSNFLRRMN